MAWTTPRTWVAGETVTAAIMNTHVRDNMANLLPVQAAAVAVTMLSGTATINSTPTFATAFTAAPTVMVTGTAASGTFGWIVTAVTTTTVTVRVFTTTGANLGVNTAAGYTYIAHGTY